MKTFKTYFMAVTGICMLVILVGCSKSTDQKLADAKANVKAAQEEVAEAVETVADAAQDEWTAFKLDAEAKIEANDKSVSAYKDRMKTSNGDMQAKYDKKIDDLEKANKKLKAKLADYKDDGKSNWAQFKTEFNHDMDELGSALKSFTVDNKK